ncbi:DUF3617 family protein [Sphingomonas sp. HITSZ_GF]|uniref:DUF3617 domain-containing protein n=1 Tax=Sphingomonas sp. HITSZ_GF TaxID=3037247 RepID=UPI00240D7FD0|nr:DUF3617 family protein [Sphingomonas sp. HITSZ_GF]MDG2534697.1 DUF3617 family protein [Sphingomonas sp. HITSZ_GF]
MQGVIRALAAPAAATALVLLTGAGRASDGFTLTDATAKQVADAYWKARPGGPMRMGQWERMIAITAFDLPGQPAAAERDALIAKAKQQKTTESVCQSGTDLAAPEPAQIFEMQGQKCHYQRLTMGGGSFAGQLSCEGEEFGERIDVAVSGSYTPERFAIRLDVDRQPVDRTQRVVMTMQLNGQRTGECAK